MELLSVAGFLSSVNWSETSITGIAVSFALYQWRQNTKIKVSAEAHAAEVKAKARSEIAKLEAQAESELVARIESSINNLAASIKQLADESKKTADSLWQHIGSLDKRVAFVEGKCEANHKD
jgi:hypothetical protein